MRRRRRGVAELLDFIAHVREVGGLPVGFKAVLGGIAAARIAAAAGRHAGGARPARTHPHGLRGQVHHRNYARDLMCEVGIIARSCGMDDPRGLRRRHCSVVVDDGLSRSLERQHPYPVRSGD